MKVCTRCLYRNEDDVAFCTSCGLFLDWSSEKVAADRASAPARPRPARRRTTPKRSAGPADGPPPGPSAAATDGAPVAAGRASEADELARAAENLRRRVEANRRRRAGLPPIEAPPRRRPKAPAAPAPAPPTAIAEDGPVDAPAGTRPTPDGPGPEQPRKAHPFDNDRPPRQAAVEDDMAPHPGDVVCARCQAGNAASRYFCRRCGSALQPEEVSDAGATTDPGSTGRRRWWQRLLWWRQHPDEVPVTPAAPATGKQRALAALPVLLLLGLVIGALGPWRQAIGERIEDARKRFSPRYEHVYPAGVEATSAVAEHPPEAAVDRAPNTYWSEGGPTTGSGEELTLRFDRPVNLGRVGFFNGAQTKPQDFLTQPRLREVHLFFDTGEAARIVLKDRDAFQNHGIEAEGVTTVRLRIVSVYPSPQGGTEASLGEVEFFTKT